MQKIDVRKLFRLSKQGEYRPIHIVLGNRALELQGEIQNITDITYHAQLQNADELSFTVYKEMDGELCREWDNIVDFKLIWVKEYDEWFEMSVTVDDSEYVTKKTITATSLCEAELSQVHTDTFSINDDNDSNWDKDEEEYIPSVFYNPNSPKFSILHRVLSKAPNYTIKHVDETLRNIQRSFSFQNTSSVYDALNSTIGKEIGCIFLFDTTERGIYVYDLESTCLNESCGYRSDYDFTVCPKCGGTNINEPYGYDTSIFVDKENLATGLNVSCDTGSVKNCFKVYGGDDIMNATVISVNPNGSNYIYILGENTRKDMPEELVNKFDDYNTLVTYYENDKEYSLDATKVAKYNAVARRITALFPSEKKWEFNEISTTYKGFYNLLDVMYVANDFRLYLTDSMMPTAKSQEKKSIEEEIALLETELKEVSCSEGSKIDSKVLAESAIKQYAKVIVDTSRFKVDIDDGATYTKVSDYVYTWSGTITLTSFADSKIYKTTNTLTVTVNDDMENYIQQAVEKEMAKIDNGKVLDLFDVKTLADFKEQIKLYCSASLKSFRDAYSSAICILNECKIGENKESELYKEFYQVYLDRITALEEEIVVRGGFDDKNMVGEGDIGAVTDIYYLITDIINEVHDTLNFEEYLGEDLYKTFMSYRREDVYSNSNYISDGFTNEQIVSHAKELLDVARTELIKSNEKQYSINGTLNNLLLFKNEDGTNPFEPWLDHFVLGYYLRTKIDGTVYKMRFSDVSLNYSDLSTISITFYDIMKNGHTVMDRAKQLMDNVSSISSTYSATQKQAEQSQSAVEAIDSFRQTGLDSAMYNVFSSSAKVEFDRNGLIARNYDDVTDQYSDEQLRINGSDIIMTDDKWETIKLAIGKQEYTLNGVTDSTYGVNAETVIGGKIIGGDIYSNNWTADSSGYTTNGTHIDLNNGYFEMQKGDSGLAYRDNYFTLVGATFRAGLIQSQDNTTTINLNNGTFSFANGKLSYNGTKLTLNGEINANSGTIGGWTIDSNQLRSTDSSVVISPSQFKFGNSFNVNSSGLSITGSVTSSTGNIAGWILSSNVMTAKDAKGYICPTETELNKARTLIFNGQYDAAYDVDNNGTLDLFDLAKIKNWMLGNETFNNTTCPIAKLSSTTLTINSSNSNSMISMSGTNQWGTSLSTNIGIGIIKTNTLESDIVKSNKFASANSYGRVASGYFVNDIDSKIRKDISYTVTSSTGSINYLQMIIQANVVTIFYEISSSVDVAPGNNIVTADTGLDIDAPECNACGASYNGSSGQFVCINANGELVCRNIGSTFYAGNTTNGCITYVRDPNGQV